MSVSAGIPRKRRGFAMLIALALVAMVAVAMAAAASIFRLDLRRTADALDDAELFQLLVAGEREAHGRLAPTTGDVPVADVLVELPASLASDGASVQLHIQPGDRGGTATATVEAALAGRVSAQTLHYKRGPAGWRLVRAELHAYASPPHRGAR